MVTYDKHYQKKEYFGKSYPDLIEFFKKLEPKGKVLDFGCGQGRDSIALARLGYNVVGVDISKVGIHQMIETAKKEKLEVKGIVDDIYEFNINDDYDIILLDSMFHFYKKDKEKETSFLVRLMNDIKLDGILCIIINKSKNAEAVLKKVFKNSDINWEVIEDKYVDYPDFNTKFRMFIVKKLR